MNQLVTDRKAIEKAESGERRPLLIAGPCSAESEEQVLATARALAHSGISWFRAGLWKPRTRPDSFAGVGAQGLSWLQKVKTETGLRTAVEVANGRHVELALEFGIDMLWIGARTTVNPFTVQEIADALKGTQVTVMVKNPINPDLELWIGAIERVRRAGPAQVIACHRGFNVYGKTEFRYPPLWEIPIELKRLHPDLPLLCDPSHICGNRELLALIAQKALDLGYEGFMIETHPDPDRALSDARQQITPEHYLQILSRLRFRKPDSQDSEYLARLAELRSGIDEIDARLMSLLAERMELSRRVGLIKTENNIAFYQHNRWQEILGNAIRNADKLKLKREFVEKLFSHIHLESIDIQGE